MDKRKSEEEEEEELQVSLEKDERKKKKQLKALLFHLVIGSAWRTRIIRECNILLTIL